MNTQGIPPMTCNALLKKINLTLTFLLFPCIFSFYPFPIMIFRLRQIHLIHLKRFFFFLIIACLLISSLLGVHMLLSPRAFNHFIFHVKQPLRYIEYLRSGYRVQNIDCVLSSSSKTFAYDDLTRIPVDTRSIFFLETSCKHETGVALSARQACSVESAAMMNPRSQVYVVIISSVRNGTRSPVIQTLYEYKNIKVVQVRAMLLNKLIIAM